ncbi:uncharacterized protein LOC105426349 [Pogonomyrmex barbatus]|uniref:Uncharacterized protein LOC105426349 n=1 Tax=Pogonomyrmex barbatus TaxID=144034 RepID=A0A6I9WAE9_9HYME|nr:uncharacterized protein LOC105426349 [Pogonomyrmex barbatus]
MHIAGLFILNDVSYVLSRRLNLTQLIKESFDPKLSYLDSIRDIPVVREVFYLPDEHYNAENLARELRQLDRQNRNLIPEYRNLCETITKKVEISDSDYEYQPPYYYEVYCKSSLLLAEDPQVMKELQQKCVHPAFHCVQRSRVLSLVRRRWEDDCWESYTKEIASGCDCMWPVTNLGEISHHY